MGKLILPFLIDFGRVTLSKLFERTTVAGLAVHFLPNLTPETAHQVGSVATELVALLLILMPDPKLTPEQQAGPYGQIEAMLKMLVEVGIQKLASLPPPAAAVAPPDAPAVQS
jgi:hypothetical protein